jgi:hypothetical protein
VYWSFSRTVLHEIQTCTETLITLGILAVVTPDIIIISSFYSLWSIGHPWRASKRCDLQLSPWPHSVIFLYFLFRPLLSFATFSSAYLVFCISEDSNPMQFSLLLLLLNSGRVTVIYRIKIFLLINPSVLHCHSAVVGQPYSSYYCKIYFGLPIYVGVLETFPYHDVFPRKFVDYVSCQSLEKCNCYFSKNENFICWNTYLELLKNRRQAVKDRSIGANK